MIWVLQAAAALARSGGLEGRPDRVLQLTVEPLHLGLGGLQDADVSRVDSRVVSLQMQVLLPSGAVGVRPPKPERRKLIVITH